jgi:hypothetical protein
MILFPRIVEIGGTHYITLKSRNSKQGFQQCKLIYSYCAYRVKGTVSPDFKVFFIIYDIKSVLSVWTLMV